MRSTLSRRRMSYVVLSAGLVAGALVPLTASAAACASWADDAGDATTRQTGVGVLGDSNLDITAAALGTVGKDLVGTITTEGLNAGSSDAGDEFRFRFTVNENDVIFYVDRTAPFGQELDVIAGFYNFTTRTGGDATAEFDVENKTVRLTGPLSELEAAVGSPVAGKPLSDLRAETLNQVLFGSITPAKYDEAATPIKPVVGTACTFPKAAPKPAADPSASASASPSASASASPSPSASGSASPEPSESPEGSASPSPSPSGPPPPPQPEVPVPADGCIGFADAAEDSNAAAGPISRGNDPDVDILSVTGRTTDTLLSGHIGVAKLGTRPSFPAFNGHRFEYEFVAGGKTVVLRANTTGEGTGRVDGTTNPDLVVTAVFDQPSSQVVLSVDRASLSKVLEAALPDGAVLTDVAARSYARTPATTTLADTARPEDAAQAVYVVGDNECFRPKMSIAAPARVQTSDIAVVSVALVTSDGRIAKKQQVTARVGTGRAVSATTDDAGTVTLLVPVVDAAGETSLVVRSFGDAGKGELRTDLRVLIERSLLTLKRSGSGSTRTVTATLTDDDAPKRALSGQRVTFTFGGRSVVATTDRAGRASIKVPAGSVVDASFAGRTGFLSAAKARTTA